MKMRDASRSKKKTSRGSINRDAQPTTETEAKSYTFDEIFEETKFGKFNYCVIFLSGVVITYSLVETTAIGYLLPTSQCDLKFTESEKGVLGAIAFAGAIVSAQFWGFLGDTMGRRKVLIPSLFLSFLSSVLSSLAGHFWVLVLFRFCAGFFAFGGSSTIYTYLGELHGTKLRSHVILGASFVFGLTYLLIPIEAWLVINQDWALDIPHLNVKFKPWRLFLVTCGLPGLICSLCFLKLPESPKFLLSQGRESEAIKAIQRIYSINTRRKGESLKVASLIKDENDNNFKAVFDKNHPIKSMLKSFYNQTVPLFKKEYIKKTALACALQFGIKATCNGLYVWLVDLLNKMVKFMNTNPGKSTTLCEVIYSSNKLAASVLENPLGECAEKLELGTYMYSLILDILYMIGFGAMGYLINVAGAIPIMFTIMVFSGLCGIAIMFVNIPLLSISLYVALLLCGLGVPVLSAATVDLYPTHIRSMAICLTLMMGRLGSLVGSNIVGLLVEDHCQTSFLLSGLSLILCGFLALLIPMPKDTVGKNTKTSEESMAGRYVKYNLEC